MRERGGLTKTNLLFSASPELNVFFSKSRQLVTLFLWHLVCGDPWLAVLTLPLESCLIGVVHRARSIKVLQFSVSGTSYSNPIFLLRFVLRCCENSLEGVRVQSHFSPCLRAPFLFRYSESSHRIIRLAQ